jgi:DNA polymerase III epsilon subunit-like protein
MEVAAFSTFVNPTVIIAGGVEGSGVTQDMLADAPDLADVITAF